MPLTLTIAALRAADAPNLEAQITDLRRVLPGVTEGTPVPLAVWWALPATGHRDRYWILHIAEPLPAGLAILVRCAILAAGRVPPRNVEGAVLRKMKAIEAAEACLADPCRRTQAIASAATTPGGSANHAAYAASAAASYVAAVRTDTRHVRPHAYCTFYYTMWATHSPISMALYKGPEEHAQQIADLDRLLTETDLHLQETSC